MISFLDPAEQTASVPEKNDSIPGFSVFQHGQILRSYDMLECIMFNVHWHDKSFVGISIPHPHEGPVTLTSRDVVVYAAALAGVAHLGLEDFARRNHININTHGQRAAAFAKSRHEFAKSLKRRFDYHNIDIDELLRKYGHTE